MKKDKSRFGHLRLPIFLIVLGLFGLVNMVLFFGQEFGRGTEKKELEELKAKLDHLKHEADNLESSIRSAEKSVKTAKTLVHQCKANIAGFESQAVDGSLPPEIYSQYTLTVDNCKTQVRNSNNLVSSYNSLYEQYDQVIQAHNTLVPQTNELAKSLGTRYYFIPVPSLRRAH
jgi:cytoskeletal protein RodZ